MRKKKSGLYAYLNSINAFGGSEAGVEAATKEYYRLYKAEWVKKKRKDTKTFTVHLTPPEYASIRQFAKRHTRSVTAYIKASCIAYTQQKFLIPNAEVVYSVRELLELQYAFYRNLMDESILPYQPATLLLERQALLEKAIMEKLTDPHRLEQRIAEAIKDTPGYKAVLIELLQKL